jgi:hypothetical protein
LGKKSTEKLVQPGDLKKAFGDATNFNAEIHKYFPKQAAIISRLK